MKLTIQEIHNIQEGLADLLDRELSVKVAFKIQLNFKKLGKEVGAANDVRRGLLNKYSEYITDGNRIKDAKIKAKYDKELDELMAQEAKVDVEKIKLSELDGHIKPRTLGLIDKLIEEE